MHKFLPVIICCLLLTSCATVFNSEKTTVFLYTENPATVLYQFDTLRTEQTKEFNAVRLRVPRSSDSLYLIVESDSMRQRFVLPPKTSATYKLNYFYFPMLLFDYGNSKRYTYNSPVVFDDSLKVSENVPESLLADMKQRNNGLKIYDKSRFDARKGSLYYNLTYPMLYPTLSTYSPEGAGRLGVNSFFGLSTGFDYYYKNNRFVNLTGNVVAGECVGCGEDSYQDEEDAVSFNLHLSLNYRFRRFSFGYGLSYTYTRWHKDRYIWETDKYIKGFEIGKSDINPLCEHREWRYSGIGAVANAYFYFTPYFYAGIIYKPNFVRLKAKSGSPFCYEHQISFDFAFKIRLFRGK